MPLCYEWWFIKNGSDTAAVETVSAGLSHATAVSKLLSRLVSG